VTFAVALLAISHANIFWSTDTKQYAFDVLAVIILLQLSIRFTEQPSRGNAIRLGIAGAVLPFFSLASVIVMAGSAAVLAVRHRHSLKLLLPVAGLWLLAAPEVLRLSTSLGPEDRAYFKADWWDGFMPLPLSAADWSLYGEALFNNLRDPLGFGHTLSGLMVLALGAAGVAWFFRRKKTTAAFLLVPVLIVWLLSVAGIYPINSRWVYAGRVTLFLTPAAYLCIAAGAAWFRVRAGAAVTAAIVVIMAAIPALAEMPYSRGEARRVFEYVSSHAQPGDRIYMYYGTELVRRYYRPQFAAPLTIGNCSQDNPVGYYRELEQLRGTKRLWLIMGQSFYAEYSLFTKYMENNAVRLKSPVHLFDFSTGRDKPLSPSHYRPAVQPNPNTACRGIFARDGGS
jgi:hypothetical protein